MNLKQFFLAFLICLTVTTFVSPTPLQAKEISAIIRDTEIENILKEWTQDVITTADLNPASVRFILVQSREVNAFVAGGANVFIYTGLIEKTETPEELIGVIAHELGHIRGGHLIRTREAMEQASYETLLGTLLGVGAALATGDGAAAAAVSQGTRSMAERGYLKHSRVQESSADQAALTYLEKAGINPDGLLTFLEKLGSDDLLSNARQSEYVRTHPLTRNRIDALRERVKASSHHQNKTKERWKDQHARMKAKLMGFISPGRVEWEYSDKDHAIPARYARAIAYYRQNKIEAALKEVNGLIALEKNNPFFYELKGQILVEFGRVKEGLPSYEKAVALMPEAPLFHMALGHSLLESTTKNDQATLEEAIKHFKIALQEERNTTRLHRYLATAYGRAGQEALAQLHLAEEAFLQRRMPYARELAEKALASLPQNTPEWQRAKDILHFIEMGEK